MDGVNPIEVYVYLLTEINKLGNEEVMRSMLNKYMLDAQDPKFIIQLGVCLLTEIRQELDRVIDWDDDPEKVAEMIHKKYMRWNADEIRHADVVVKTSHEVKEEREKREKNKAEKDALTKEENKKRSAARKAKKGKVIALDESKPTKVIGNIGGYSLESAIS
jgi:hypothetical protein